MSIEILVKDHHPQRSIALVTQSHTLIFRHSPSTQAHNGDFSSNNNSFASIVDRNNGSSSGTAPRCMVELAGLDSTNLDNYRRLTSQPCFGTLGLITLGGDIFICIVTGAREVASVRPGENVSRIHAVQFREFCTHTGDSLPTNIPMFGKTASIVPIMMIFSITKSIHIQLSLMAGTKAEASSRSALNIHVWL